MSMTNLDRILSSTGNNQKMYAPESNHEALDQRSALTAKFVTNAKKFYLDVEKAQGFYDSYEDLKFRHITQTLLQIPFPETLFTFEKGLKIKWVDITRTQDVFVDLIGFGIEELPIDAMPMVERKMFRAYLFFDEGLIGEDSEIVSQQTIDFSCWEVQADVPFNKNSLLHLEHYPCREPELCMVADNGLPKDWAESPMLKGNFHPCQEIKNRDSLVEVMFEICERLNDYEYVERRHKRKHFAIDKDLTYTLPQMAVGWPHTKGNLPKDNYVQYIDTKRYRSNHGEINYGAGMKHKYRYDVRRHPRIVNGKIKWISAHQRGSGSYIPKIYANRKEWFVNYLWYQAEQLTRHRIIEIMIVKAISFIRRVGRG